MYVIETLKAHDRKAFDCGEESLNRYFRERATQDIKRKVNRVFIIRQEAKEQVLGYYTLAATTVEAATLPPAHARRLPAYPIGAVLLGKLAVDKAWHGKTIGTLLLTNAIRRTQLLARHLGIHALVVDPMNEALVKFYASFGFYNSPPGKRLFLFMDSLDNEA